MTITKIQEEVLKNDCNRVFIYYNNLMQAGEYVIGGVTRRCKSYYCIETTRREFSMYNEMILNNGVLCLIGYSNDYVNIFDNIEIQLLKPRKLINKSFMVGLR